MNLCLFTFLLGVGEELRRNVDPESVLRASRELLRPRERHGAGRAHDDVGVRGSGGGRNAVGEGVAAPPQDAVVGAPPARQEDVNVSKEALSARQAMKPEGGLVERGL